jgi:hypothetical protein
MEKTGLDVEYIQQFTRKRVINAKRRGKDDLK